MNSSRRPPMMGVQVENVSPEELYQVIVAVSSQDPSIMQPASQRLTQMLEMFGAYDALQDIASQKPLPLFIRQHSIIAFKNSVVNHWRSRKLLSDEHRVRIRERSFLFLDEDDDTIAKCNETVVVKLARSDFPGQWPNLVSNLVNIIDLNLQRRYVTMVDDPGDTLRLRRSLGLLNKILKEFSSIKLPNGLKAMALIVDQLRTLLYGYYSTMAGNFSKDKVSQEFGSQKLYENILLAHLVYKCLVKMATWLWNKLGKLTPEEHQRNLAWVEELFVNSAAQVQSLADIRKNVALSLINKELPSNELTPQTVSILTRHLKVFGKFFRRLQQLSQDRFVQLPAAEDLVHFYWSQVIDSESCPKNLVFDSNEALYPVRFLVQGMVLFKECLSQWTPVRRNGTPNKNALSSEFVQNAVKLLVFRFMPLNEADLNSWQDDPEAWVNDEDKENEQWEYEIRGCSERVLMQLCNHFSDVVVALLQSEFTAKAPQICDTYDSIVQKEALYCAIGRCALRIRYAIDFDAWLDNTCVLECHEKRISYRIIKRRIAWLLGKWVSESCTSPNNTRIWDVLSHLLRDEDEGPEHDVVVRLTAVSALRECVDVLGFEPTAFAPYLSRTVPQLIRIMAEADTLDSKRRVDDSLNTIIEQAGMLILQFMDIITQPIPNLWQEAGHDYLFKASLLVTVTKVVEAVKQNSGALAPLIVPLIRESLSPAAIIQLDNDALNLWISALRNSSSIVPVGNLPSLRDIFPEAVDLLATNLDLLGSITRIIESYFLLDAPYVLQTYSNELFTAYLGTFSNKIIDYNMKELLQSLSLLVQLAPSQLWGLALHNSGLFAHLLKTMIAGEADTFVLTEHIYLFSRIVMSDRNMFLELIRAASNTLNRSENVIYDNLLDQWWGKFDNMSEPRHRKLTAMGIAALVSTARPEVLNRLPGEIFNLWLDVFGEIKEAQEQAAEQQQYNDEPPSPTNLVRYWELDSAPSSYFRDTDGTPEYDRRKAVYDRDPIRVAQLVPYVGERLREAEAACGSTNFQVYINNTDPTVLKQIQDALIQG